MLYEKLNDEMRKTVDEFASACQELPWRERGGLLACTASPFEATFESSEASLAARGFITAVLERLAADGVEGPDHAALLTLSLNPFHRSLAEEYYDAHPEAAPGAGDHPPPRRKEWIN